MKYMKNILVLALSMFLFNACMERTTYEIVGTAIGYEDGSTVQLVNQERDVLGETEIINGKFSFAGQVEEPHVANILFPDKRAFLFILENAEYKIHRGKGDGYIQGGEINDIVFGYELEKEYRDLRKAHAEAPDPFEGVDRMDKEAVTQARKILRARRGETTSYEKKYKRSIIEGDYPVLAKMYVLSFLYDWENYGIDKQIKLYNEYEKELGPHPYLVKTRQALLEAKKRWEIQESVKPGKPFKDVIAQTVEGDQLKLSDVVAKNKYTLFEVWSSSCGPCRGEFPHLKKAYAHYHKKGFEIYALSVDRKEKHWLKALEEEDVPWLNVVDYKGFKGKAAIEYGLQGIPASFLIDQHGTIVASMEQVRGFGLDEKLEELFSEQQ